MAHIILATCTRTIPILQLLTSLCCTGYCKRFVIVCDVFLALLDTVIDIFDFMVSFRRQRVKDLSKEKREKLSDSLLYAKFNRDVAEVSQLPGHMSLFQCNWVFS